MKPTSLRSLFSSILLGHFGALATLSGCSDTPPVEPAPSGPPTQKVGEQPEKQFLAEGFSQFSCYPLLSGVAAAFGVDSIEQWSYQPTFEGGKDPVDPKAERLDSDGTACANAPDPPLCLIDVERARIDRSQGGFVMPFYGPGDSPIERLVLTKAGEVRTVNDQGQLAALLGPIDTPEKLRLFAHYSSHDLPCGFIRRDETGFELAGFLGGCSDELQRRVAKVTPAGEVAWLEGGDLRLDDSCYGRRPAGLAGQTLTSGGALGRYLERQAYLEAASVEAFDRLALELEALGAPPELAAEARRAREDEVRHHALAVALGRGFDPNFACRPPEAAKAEPRSLFAFALENAIEGCVRETWGALLARHQAARAEDHAVRVASSIIADDETRHAELAWATHAWLLGRLGEGERRELGLGMRRAVDELVAEAASGDGLSPDEMALLGLPSAGEARALLGRLGESLWAEPLAA